MLATDRGLAAVYFDRQRERIEARLAPNGTKHGFGNLFLLRAEAWLACYFDGDLGYSAEMPLDLLGTQFQREVWAVLKELRPGQTASYGQIAREVGRPNAARAVGAAVGQNPVSIILPCHRVAGSDGSLTGYAGGLDVKRALIQHEAHSLDSARAVDT